MMSRLPLLLFIFSLGMITVVNAQHREPCSTMEQDSINRARFPERGTLEDFEYILNRKVLEIRARKAQGRVLTGVVSIPIIVHVVHNGEAVGTGTNISQAQVQAQIDVLNEDFRKKPGTPGYNTNPVGADIEIEFCLSPVDENGNTLDEPGIHRYDGNQADWSQSQIENQLKPITIWNPNLFYNIWTVKFAASNANLLGYAQFPDQSGLSGLPASGSASTDGVVIRYKSFGSVDKGSFPVMEAPYNKGRTLSHETGHWLGLRHIWGDGVCADDFCADTPTQRTSSSGCPNSLACNNVTPAMVQNYMDYSNDACMNIFTEDQKERMRAVMEVSPRRKSLIEGNLCNPIVADVPTANFGVDELQCVLLGSEITFTDLSTNFPTEWLWEFEGGDPNTSTERNPKVKYNNPGSFKVTLISKNSLGPSVPLIMDNFINVSEEGLCRSFSNFEDSFTPTVLNLSSFGSYTGYLTGHNSIKSKAFSERFTNDCGYEYISGVKLSFDKLVTDNEEATVTVTVWNARGKQGSPGAVIERKTLLLRQIKEDIENEQPTSITFDRLTPIFGNAFHVGVEISYDQDYALAIVSSENGEALNATSWIQNKDGEWNPFAIAFGANIAMDIQPVIGMNPSVHVAASKQLIYPGEEVILNGSGASIFIWNADDGSVDDYAGPQLIVRPANTTTYLTTGSGMELCDASTLTTIYIRENILGSEDNLSKGISVLPNPGTSSMVVKIENNYRGDLQVNLQSILGQNIQSIQVNKSAQLLEVPINTFNLKAGLYLVRIVGNGKMQTRKWIKVE